MSRSPLLRAVALAGLLATGACDLFGPSGPGTMEATVESDRPLGAVVLELTGPGIEGFEGIGQARVWGTPMVGDTARHRVVVVAPGEAPLRFGIRVVDRGAELPAIAVVAATTRQNVRTSSGGIQVRVDR